MKLKQILSAVLAGAMCLSLAACGGQGGTPDTEAVTETTAKTVVLTESWEFSSGFNPVISAATSVNYGFAYWSHNCYDTLVAYNDSGEIEGRLAERWEVSEDGTVYTFHLREGVTFSDGEALTAAAVKKSFQMSIAQLGQFNGSYGKLTTLISSMEAADERTFVLTLTQPYYGTLNDLSMANPLGIVSPAVIGDDLTPSDALLTGTYGTGPYLYAGDFADNTYTFVRNPNYWGEAPELDSFQVKVIADNDAKILALRNGEIDAVIGSDRMSADGFGELSGMEGFGTKINSASTKTRYLGINLMTAPFDDVLVRKAVAYAVDQQSIAQAVFNGTEAAAETLFCADQPYCDVETVTYETDPERSRALLEQAGWVDTDGDGIREKDGQPLSITITYSQSLASIDNMALAIEGQLEAVGFDVTLNAFADMMGWYSSVMAGDYSICLWYTYGGAFDPSAVMTNINPAASTDVVAFQWADYITGGAGIIDELDSSADPARIQEIYASVLADIADQCLIVPVTHQQETAIWNASVIEDIGFSRDQLYIEVARITAK